MQPDNPYVAGFLKVRSIGFSSDEKPPGQTKNQRNNTEVPHDQGTVYIYFKKQKSTRLCRINGKAQSINSKNIVFEGTGKAYSRHGYPRLSLSQRQRLFRQAI